MNEILLFCEDLGHQQLIAPLIARLASEKNISVKVRVLTATGGRGRLYEQIKLFFKRIERGSFGVPDAIVCATDANCQGLTARKREVQALIPSKYQQISVCAIPDPHVERWMLLDSAAFKLAVGEGCNAPDLKCEKNRYKTILADSVRGAGVAPLIGGLEYADKYIGHMNIDQVKSRDSSFGDFVDELSVKLNSLRRA